jgi:hypothetical protein
MGSWQHVGTENHQVGPGRYATKDGREVGHVRSQKSLADVFPNHYD